MIWYDARTGQPVAPGEGEDGGPPSIDYYHCPTCCIAREMKWTEQYKEMRCVMCQTTLLVQG